MEDEILKIMAAEIAGENVTKEEREKMNRWWSCRKHHPTPVYRYAGLGKPIHRRESRRGGADGLGNRSKGKRLKAIKLKAGR
jgi:transmembrane sensor